ncbi:alpha-1,2-fucosyltransferase [Vibrio fluvialis]|nr:alpha-1,2-fucosyltransferase [Vibrio fluvialis]MBY8077490.1 alpha-1,2-fucosyltransferase [Vibrio fluvialis]MBY8147892.1 alpha-1,2-fucosyltransferase [Vibrio fluvialis]
MINKVINVRLAGGLGNQLYQFSYAYYLFKKHGFDFIEIDCEGMSSYNENWGYLLQDVFDKNKIESIVKYSPSIIHKCRIARILNKCPRLGYILGLCNDNNQELFSDKIIYNKIYLDGYFENFFAREKYLEMIKGLLRDDLRIPIKDNVVVVNVRGGEYARLGYSKPSDIDYYKKQINRIISEKDDVEFHLVTDDIEYAVSLFQETINFSKIHEPCPFDNFRVLYSAKTKILSRSTFSKWAGYLSSEFSDSIYLDEF